MNRHHITIHTPEAEKVMDITDAIQEHIAADVSIAHICVLHTTCALTTADLDPGTDQDMMDAFRAMTPKLAYRHPHNPDHVGDHILASIIGPSITLPCKNGSLILGTWQRVVLIEFDGPRDREIILTTE